MSADEIAVCTVVSVIISVICNKILAAYTFKVIDSYVRDMIELAEKSIRDAYSRK